MTTTSSLLNSYTNGNTKVEIYSDGTKVRTYPATGAYVDYPESIDVKITNYCDMACLYCHETSTLKGSHGDLNKLELVLHGLPQGIELAIGGGNPLSHPELIQFLMKCKLKGYIPNLTVNQGHLKQFKTTIEYLLDRQLIYGIGVSITDEQDLSEVYKLKERTDNLVAHLIIGINNPTIFKSLKDIKTLLLGYKTYGMGKLYYSKKVEINIQFWNAALSELLNKSLISFDNLAIEQLKVQERVTKEFWDTYYLGNDFTHSMYVDAVNQEFAPTSRSLKNERNKEYYANNQLVKYFQENKGSL